MEQTVPRAHEGAHRGRRSPFPLWSNDRGPPGAGRRPWPQLRRNFRLPLAPKVEDIFCVCALRLRRQDIVTHAAYIIPFGISATMRYPRSDAPIPMPGWLLGFEWEVAMGQMPCFTLSPRSPSDLGTYKQKNVDLCYWVEGLHQLILSVSLSPRRAAGSQPRVTA